MDIYNYLKTNYKEDGFIYCIKTGIEINKREIVKCGRIEMKIEEDEIEIVNKLLRRYNTYYADCEILYWKRVGNNKEAEKRLFEKIKELHYEKEKFWLDERIKEAFEEVETEYPSIEDTISKIPIEKQTKLNVEIRLKEK